MNYVATGLPVLRALAEDPEINVPILAHMDVAGAFHMSPQFGMSSHIMLGKLARLAGADIVVHPAPYGKATVLHEKFLKTAQTLLFPPMHNLAPTFPPMPSGGITQPVIPSLLKDLGTDIVIGSGGGIHAHPPWDPLPALRHLGRRSMRRWPGFHCKKRPKNTKNWKYR